MNEKKQMQGMPSSHDYDDLFTHDGAHDEQQKLSRKERERRKKHGRKVGIIAGIVVLFGFAVYAFFRLWRITEFHVEGLSNISEEEVLGLANIQSDIPFYQYRPKEWKEHIQNNPHMVVQNISFAFPNRCNIVIEERVEYAVVQVAQQYVYVDENAVVLDITSTPKEQDALMVRGLSVSGFTVKEELGIRDEYQLYVLKELMHALQDTGQRGWYIVADLTNSVDIYLLTDHNIQVCFGGASDLSKKLVNASAVLNTLESENKQGGRLDVIRFDNIIYSPNEDDVELENEEAIPSLDSDQALMATSAGIEENHNTTSMPADRENAEEIPAQTSSAPFVTTTPTPKKEREEDAIFDQIPVE